MAILYTFAGSVWSVAPELAVAELGLTDVEKKTVNLFEGANFDPSFIKINPSATLPTLEADGKVYTNTTDVVAYLIKHAPSSKAKRQSFFKFLKKASSSDAPKAKTGDAKFLEAIHADGLDPNFALLSTRDEAELKAKAASIPGLFVANRQDALLKYSVTPEAAPFKEFYAAKIAGNGGLDSIYKGKVPEDVKLGFFEASKTHWVNIGKFVGETLPAHLPESGFIGGTTPGEDDFHAGAWLGRIAAVTGAAETADGLASLEKALGPLSPKVAAYWKAWIARPSWQAVYADGKLH